MGETEIMEELSTAVGSAYHIERELAHAPGIAAFAAQAADGRHVEIKTVPGGLFGSHGQPGEAVLVARRLKHPNIVTVVDAGARGDFFIWCAPTVDGRSLRARLSRGGRMHMRDSLTVLRDVSAALTHAHLHGVVHGGLSPDSVLISGGSALVSDIGVPEVYDALRRSVSTDDARSAAAGALRYASPEQAAGGHADARSDVYAWGVIAYELLSGRHPFAGRTTPRQMMAAHTDEEPAQLPAGLSDVPSAVIKLVMRCLSKQPAKRPESAREIFALMTREMLVPPPAPSAGSGQNLMMGLMIAAVALIALIAWLGMRT